jgi:hypothetical protein
MIFVMFWFGFVMFSISGSARSDSLSSGGSDYDSGGGGGGGGGG